MISGNISRSKMYSYELRESLEKEFQKLAKRNPKLLLSINKKIEEILDNPYHYKNLKKPLKSFEKNTY